MQDNSAIEEFSVLTDAQLKEILSEKELSSLSGEAKQKLIDTVTEALLKRIFIRISHVFTQEDIGIIERLDKNDTNGDSVKYFVFSRVPHFLKLIEEETIYFKEEIL